MTYRYWLLRYVPDVLRGERVNVGVVVGSDEADDWAIRKVSSFARANRLGGGDAADVLDGLIRLEDVISPGGSWKLPVDARLEPQRISSGWMDRVRRQQQNNLQIAAPQLVRATSAAEAADVLFELLVVEPSPRATSRGRNEAVRELRHAFLEHHLRRWDLQADVRLTTGRQRTKFDVAVGRERVAQLTQVWSFDLQRMEPLRERLQAANFVTYRLRKQGGELTTPGRKQDPVEVSQDVPVRVLYVPPVKDIQREVLDEAREAWRDLDVRPVPLSEVDSIAEEAERLLRDSRFANGESLLT